MGSWKTFEEIEAWKKERVLAKEIYHASSVEPFSRDFELKSQIRRASGSVMDNIAAGFGRGGKGEFVQFLGFAKGSIEEVKSQLYRAMDTDSIKMQQLEGLFSVADEVGKMICGLIKYLNSSDIRGQKHKR